MFASRAGQLPVFMSCALAALLAGCASSSTQTSYDATVAPRTMAQAPQLEDDGLPSQAPPPASIRAIPDEPDEPYSNNYGGGNPAKLRAAKTAALLKKTPKGGVPVRALRDESERRLAYGWRPRVATALAENE